MLSVQNFYLTFTMYNAGFTQMESTAITDINLQVNAGEIVAVVGASGSGKSLLAHAILGILPMNTQISGHILFKGEPLTPERQAILRGKEIALIPQSVSYLDPLMPVGAQITRAARLSGLSPNQTKSIVEQTLQRYGLDLSVKNLYPFQLSGGMARRVLIATAAVGKADLMIADEPTSSLHPELVSEILQHLRELADLGKGVILITHDLAAALEVADRVAVFYAGTTLEVVTPIDFIEGKLRHPYTQALWKALPENDFVATSSWCTTYS